MSDVSVEIFQDQGSPLGGYAVIRFNGLWLLPPNATFTIEPVDEKMAGGRKEGWPAGKRRQRRGRYQPGGRQMPFEKRPRALGLGEPGKRRPLCHVLRSVYPRA